MSSATQGARALEEVVKEGPLVSRGMPAFREVPDALIEDIAHYLRQRAREVAASEKAKAVVEKGQ